MAKYRTYKNGITGHRYNGYYIIKGETKGAFAIWNEDGTVFKDGVYDYEDCEWVIDKATASQEDLSVMQSLYEKEIYQLSSLFVELMQKKEREGLDAQNETLYKWVETLPYQSNFTVCPARGAPEPWWADPTG